MHPGDDGRMAIDGKFERGSGCASLTRIALSALLLVGNGASAFAQGSDQKLVNEIVRKAEARKAAAGFCASTGWPPGADMEGFTAFLRGAATGSWIARTFVNGGCVVNRVTEVHQENGGRCVGYTFYICPKDGQRGLGSSIDCLDPNGKFLSRRPG